MTEHPINVAGSPHPRVPESSRFSSAQGRCHCMVFDPLTQPRWRVLRESAGEYHAYGDHGRLYVGLLPDACKAEGFWRIVAHSVPERPPVWYMDFDFHTPPELIRAVTAELAVDVDSVAEPRPYLSGKCLGDMGEVWQPLADAGWTLSSDEMCYLASSPDGVTTLTYMPSRKGLHALLLPEAWLLEVVPDPDADPLWCAMFHDETPLHLIAAFTAALAKAATPIPEGVAEPAVSTRLDQPA